MTASGHRPLNSSRACRRRPPSGAEVVTARYLPEHRCGLNVAYRTKRTFVPSVRRSIRTSADGLERPTRLASRMSGRGARGKSGRDLPCACMGELPYMQRKGRHKCYGALRAPRTSRRLCPALCSTAAAGARALSGLRFSARSPRSTVRLPRVRMRSARVRSVHDGIGTACGRVHRIRRTVHTVRMPSEEGIGDP